MCGWGATVSGSAKKIRLGAMRTKVFGDEKRTKVFEDEMRTKAFRNEMKVFGDETTKAFRNVPVYFPDPIS